MEREESSVGISDLIASFLQESLEETDGGVLEVQRNDLAQRFNCVPSQINYVMSTRFSPERGYIVESRRGGNGLEDVRPVISSQELMEMKKEVEEVFVHDQVYDYIVRLAQATRNNDALEIGLSPRGSLALLKMAQARAYRKGRSFVIPADVAAEFQDVAAHRVQPVSSSGMDRVRAAAVLERILKETPAPAPEKG